KDSRSLAVPCTRPLLRITTTSETLELDLAALTIPGTAQPAWLEVTVAATAEPAAALYERMQSVLQHRHAEVVALRRSNVEGSASTGTAGVIQELRPADVFEAVLENAAVPAEEREALRPVFARLLERHLAMEAEAS
ncbi:MAG TPA: exonuclease SbcCD subunit D C-terminal domain-containing protein, partial [Verrucomicrobiales bacterium]|nr:exonuclease SbcCD subunit D C-terminal domain-containing protein [Verrucomicrobiales bacterium]